MCFVTIYETTLYVVVPKNRVQLMNVYHCYSFEKTQFLEDFICKTKPFSPFLREKIDKENPLGIIGSTQGAEGSTAIPRDLFLISFNWGGTFNRGYGIQSERRQVPDFI
jgi:hypothetical protein